MKILFTIPTLTYSGAPKMMAWIANQMAARGHDVQIVAFFSDERAQALNENVRFSSLNAGRSRNRIARNTVGMAQTLLRLHKTVKGAKADVVVAFHCSVGYAYLPIGRLFTRSKFVTSERADPYSSQKKIAKLRFFLMMFAHSFAFQTEGARSYFKRRFRKIYKRGEVIPNPVVASEKTRAIRQNPPSFEERDDRVVTVGRLSMHQKRQDVLLEAFKAVRETRPELRLVMYGDGEDKRRIQALVDKMGLTDCATLAGRVSDVEATIAKARAFVLSSDYEGIPNALIEALSVGVPSVSTDCSPGGAALLIKDGENGFLVPRGDAKALAEKLAILVDDKETSERFSANGPAIESEFSEETIAELWENYFKRLVNVR